MVCATRHFATYNSYCGFMTRAEARRSLYFAFALILAPSFPRALVLPALVLVIIVVVVALFHLFHK